jgi:hypothetical protein
MDTIYHPDRTAWPKRPRFAPRQHLTAQQLNGIAADELRRQRLITRAMHGTGVVFGYRLRRIGDPPGEEASNDAIRKAAAGAGSDDQRELAIDKHRIHIACGLIFDRHGRDLYWPGGWLDPCDIAGKQPDHDGRYTLNVHYAEQTVPPDGCGPCPSDAEQWIKQGVVFTLTPDCKEDERKCPDAHCVTLTDYVCGRTGSTARGVEPAKDLEWACRDPGEVKAAGCDDWRYDAEAGIAIACVWIGKIVPDGAPCGPLFGFLPKKPEVCSVRPFVYRNPLLFELAKECHTDFPRVKSLSWQSILNQAIDWDDFVYLCDPSKPPDRPDPQKPPRPKGLEIFFTEGIQISTLHVGSILLSVVVQERKASYFEASRIWLKAFEPLEVHGDGKLARGVRLKPHPNWITSELNDEQSSLDRGALIELTIRGQLLRNACGQMLDARPLDVELEWPGQKRPGGDFIALFSVRPKEGQKSRGLVA